MMQDDNSMKTPLALSKQVYVKMMSAIYIELHTSPKRKNLYETHIHNFMVDITDVLKKYFGTEGLAGQMTNREHIYNINYSYPTTQRDEMKTKVKRKIKHGTKTLRQFLGI